MIEINANGIKFKVTYNSNIGTEELRKAIRCDVSRAVENECIHNRIVIDGETVFSNQHAIKEIYNPIRNELRGLRDQISSEEYEARCKIINEKIEGIKAAKIDDLTDMILARFHPGE